MSVTDRLITLDRLRVVLDAYGADPERWPAEERASAVALIDGSAEARALFEETARLDRALDRLPEPAVSAALYHRVRRLEAPPRLNRLTRVLEGIGEWLQPGSRFAWQGVVAAAAVVGIVAGIGFSELVLDHATPTPQTAALENRTPPFVLIGGLNGVPAATGSLTLEQDVPVLSLTGGNGTGSGTAWPPEEGETSLASIPLY